MYALSKDEAERRDALRNMFAASALQAILNNDRLRCGESRNVDLAFKYANLMLDKAIVEELFYDHD